MIIEGVKVYYNTGKLFKTFQMLFKGIVIFNNILNYLSFFTFQIIFKLGKKVLKWFLIYRWFTFFKLFFEKFF
ncbi:hypothetical protein RB2501_04420 [Robiginitalea biformata HTCC2501]|uniref:Uncharacterized protein n=1 Tax=Robiginitalea biformata (strain ATCC BAA-864 / DSM 15991 / KCTC 12146 / HTCC2501) TaxID=313596 RepID=A4CGQ4_ROBBH|nr:hypothetical protein RB2501_04420 [Robiginitalea biformata HTCC2501]